MPYSYWYKLFYTFVEVGFLVKLDDDSSFCRFLSMNNLQSEEFLSNQQSEEQDSFYSIPQIERICFCENLQNKEFLS